MSWLRHPEHGHSFHAVASEAKGSFLSLRRRSSSLHCLLCHNVLDDHLCTCLACGLTIHRRCLSTAQQSSRDNERSIPICTGEIKEDADVMAAPPVPTVLAPELKLLEDLSLDPLQTASPRSPREPQTTQNKALMYVRRYAPYVAGGVLVGGAAVMGMPMVALTGLGVGLSAKGWAKPPEPKKSMDTKWARRICWELKQKSDIGDKSYKQDAELLRRYHNANEKQPTSDDIYNMLYGLFASTDELIGRINSALCEEFRARRKVQNSLAETIEDAQVYVGHVLAVTMNTYPALSTTEQSMVDTTEAVEKIVYSDIYSTVFAAFRTAYASHDTTLRARIREVRALRPDMSVEAYLSTGSSTQQTCTKDALEALQNMHELKYPLAKLQAISQAFRSISNVAETRYASAPNADMLLPMVMDLIVYANISNSFVAQLAFISTLTHGGGRGVEGYALTTFHVALRALASIDVQNMTEDYAMMSDMTDEEDEVFFDALDT
ncbi:hypothetical protein THRCLA_11211 [Thraustotheca clavata]|uniref:VPS9 domain-containing protein n=1 Tax=Thraustotheca clavata TaxID=74557 RepID=A0A1V9Y8J2_9STRA|nr:hypothetical protein THRCLA_11211 [Thraustotheca clavata]